MQKLNKTERIPANKILYSISNKQKLDPQTAFIQKE